MVYVIAVFRSRNETFYLANMLAVSGNQFMVINTPKEAGQACGVSVRFNEGSLPFVKKCLREKPFRAFVGLFRVAVEQNKLKLEKIS